MRRRTEARALRPGFCFASMGVPCPRHAQMDRCNTHAPATPWDCRPAIVGGAIFVDENGEGPGVRLRKAPKGTGGLG